MHSQSGFNERDRGQWKIKRMQPMCLCIISRRQIRETFENTQWRKDKQMQPVWLCMLWAECIEESFENPQWGNQKMPRWFGSNDNISSAGQRMQCKVHTFRVLSQDFGEKSKKIGGNLVTWLPAFWMYVYNINKCIKYSRNSLSTAGTGLTLIFWFWKMNRAASTTVSCNALFLSSSEMSCPAKFYYYTLHYSNVGRFFCTPAPPKIYEKTCCGFFFQLRELI